jgi:glycerol-3-phosphate acyltransferase PlsY
VIVFALELLLAYLLGSISGSLLLGRWRGVDIRTQGSGNAGGTNAFRTQGALFALGVVAVDLGKGALAAWIGTRAWFGAEPLFAAPIPALATAAAATLGHVWPVFYGFKGGKGAGTLVGALLVLFPLCALPLLLVWLLLLTTTGYVGLATVCAGAVLPLVAWWWAPASQRTAWVAFGALAAVFLAFTHRGNLARLRAGTEHRFELARVLVHVLRSKSRA